MNDPFARLPVVPSFTVTSTDVTDGQPLPPAQMSDCFRSLAGTGHGPGVATVVGGSGVRLSRWWRVRAGGGQGRRNDFEHELRRPGITQKNGKPNHPQT